MRGLFIRLWIFVLSLFAVIGMSAAACASEGACQKTKFQNTSFTICKYDIRTSEVRTFLNDHNGTPYGTFKKLNDDVQAKGGTLRFAMNGGMYHANRSAVGLYIESGVKHQNLNTNSGPGNFHMLPNGVFSIWQKDNARGAIVQTAEKYKRNKTKDIVRYATQSGPMLVIDGAMHPKFGQNSTSKYIRNGVGVDGHFVYFVISDDKVNFYNFASLFRDYLKTPNALYLDGTVSKMYAPELGRKDFGLPMGPMIAVVEGAK